ncbi:MAG: zf-HC2 domain-containing protein [Rubrivivax sp.]|nr:zf-HC2 domain-containing protein [Pyrinomonadaceae bacterium]
MALKLYSKAMHAARYFLLRRLPPCKQMAVVMSESMDRPLTLRERVEMKLHLWVCVWCVWYLEQLRALRETLRARAASDMDADAEQPHAKLTDDARERIRRALVR